MKFLKNFSKKLSNTKLLKEAFIKLLKEVSSKQIGKLSPKLQEVLHGVSMRFRTFPSVLVGFREGLGAVLGGLPKPFKVVQDVSERFRMLQKNFR